MPLEGAGGQPAADRIHRANKAFKLITTAVYLRRGKKKKNADGEKPFSWLLGLLEMCVCVCVGD